jgi:hypothetical protein
MNPPRLALFVSLAAAVAAAFFVMELPAEQRLRRLDERRVVDLRMLANAADRYFYRERRLPAAVDELIDGRFFTRAPTDPATAQPYEYRITGGGSSRSAPCSTARRVRNSPATSGRTRRGIAVFPLRRRRIPAEAFNLKFPRRFPAELR